MMGARREKVQESQVLPPSLCAMTYCSITVHKVAPAAIHGQYLRTAEFTVALQGCRLLNFAAAAARQLLLALADCTAPKCGPGKSMIAACVLLTGPFTRGHDR